MKKPSSGKIRSSKQNFSLLVVVFGCLSGCLGEPAPLPPDQALANAARGITRILVEDEAYAQRAADRTAPKKSAITTSDPAEIQFWAFAHPLVSRAMTRTAAPQNAATSSIKSSSIPGGAFMALHPEVKLHYQFIGEWDLAIQKLTVTMAAGDLPDVALLKRDWLPRLAEAGIIAPLDNIIPTSLRDDLREPVRASLSYHDLLYALPADGFCSVLFSNREWVPQPPKNWEELHRCVTALASLNSETSAALGSLPYLEMLWSADGDVCAKGACSLNSNAAKESLDLFTTLQREKAFAQPGLISTQNGLGLLMGRHVAMTVAFSDALPQILKAPFPVTCSPIPGKHGPIARLSDNIIVVFSHHAIEKADAISKLLNYLTGSETQGMEALKMGSVPVRNSVSTSLASAPDMTPLRDAFHSARTPPFTFSWSAIEFELNRNLDLAFRWEAPRP